MTSRKSVLALLACVLCLPAAGQAPSQQNSALNPALREEFLRGQEALAAGKFGEAITAFKKALKLDKNCNPCYLGISFAYLRTGELDKALENSDNAITSASDDEMRAMGHNSRGTALFAAGGNDAKKFQQAEAEFREATRLKPGNQQYHLNLASALLKESRDELAIAELKTCVALSPNSALAEQAKRLIAEPRRGREEFAPAFRFTTLQGQDVSLEQLSGKVVVLDFWATWCPPCRESVPELKQLTRKYPTEKLALISISADQDEGAWREFVAKKNMDWPQFRDSDGKTRGAFSVRAFPTYLVIDGSGAIRQRIVGMNPQETIVHRLRDLLASMPQLEGEQRN
jgi:thioredoxin-like negative regulator of GroEL